MGFTAADLAALNAALVVALTGTAAADQIVASGSNDLNTDDNLHITAAGFSGSGAALTNIHMRIHQSIRLSRKAKTLFQPSTSIYLFTKSKNRLIQFYWIARLF